MLLVRKIMASLLVRKKNRYIVPGEARGSGVLDDAPRLSLRCRNTKDRLVRHTLSVLEVPSGLWDF
jgi:hypothetical protein